MKAKLLFLFCALFLSWKAQSQTASTCGGGDKINKYEAAMKQGEKLLEKGDLEGAKNMFTTAILLDPSAQLPKAKMKEIDEKLQNNRNNELKVNNLIKEGDTFFANKKFVEAKAKFIEVLKLSPTNSYASTKIMEIEALLKK